MNMTDTTPIKRIALTGKLRSGKSTVAGYLTYEHGFHRIAFGDSLKYFADKIFDYLAEDITRPCPFGDVEVVGKRKPRKLYQKFGQLMREIDPDVWIKHAEKSMRTWENFRDTRGIVIDDLRQPNEYEWARDNGFVIIRIVADDILRLDRANRLGDIYDESALNHETESHIDTFDVDYEIVNNGNLDDLKRQIDEIMEEID